MLKENDIPQLTSSAPYRVDVSLDFLIEHLDRFKRRGLNLDPDFQRGHVWTPDLKIKWIEFLLRGGKPTDILFNHPSWRQGGSGEFVVVDGKQRLTACIEFLQDKFTVFASLNGNPIGYLASQLDPVILMKTHIGFAVNELKSQEEVLRWYLELNEGHIAHKPEELARVRALLHGETPDEPYEVRCEQARKTQKGDNWKHRKTGKTVIVLSRKGYDGIELLHHSGRITTKQEHYLAGEYNLVTSQP